MKTIELALTLVASSSRKGYGRYLSISHKSIILVFLLVLKRLETSNGYCIIAKNTSYGLSVYDHIVLDASVVGDGQLLYR